MPEQACVDGNEAVARVAHALSEVIAIYPITPASAMGELADAWSAAGRVNLWGSVPTVVQLQSEGGAAGTLHGATQKGVLATTFTASQGLLLMLPDMFKIAGELSPTVIHVAARAVATHALSIFGDHSDVMAARTTGFALLSSSSVQEAHDFALVSHAASLRSRVPFLHFMDGFRTSHEVNRIDLLSRGDLAALISVNALLAHRGRALDPNQPVLRGTAQDPDVFFQAREAANTHYLAVPETVQELFDQLAVRTGRRYGLVDYHGAPDAERVLVLMGSAAGAVRETVDALVARGERVGVVTVRLYRPFPTEALLDALPPTTRAIAVMDRTKEPGAVAEPLYADVVAALVEGLTSGTVPLGELPDVTGARYGLASKELTPQMVKGLLDELDGAAPRRRVTLGIVDDVTNLSVTPDEQFRVPRARLQAVLYGLGSDGTVGAARSSVRIAAEEHGQWAQGYFVYDSKKSGSVTASHIRIDDRPIRSTYLVDEANLVACHQLALLDRIDVLARAARGATFLLASPHPPDQLWAQLPSRVQSRLIELDAELWSVDAHGIAKDVGIPGRINTVMQPCFLVLAGLLEPEQAVAAVRRSIEEEYGKRGRSVVERNVAAAERALAAMARVDVPRLAVSAERVALVLDTAPDFVSRVTARIMAGEGDRLPVSAFPVDGTFPTGTAKWEKRAIAAELPVWDPDLCIDCGKCAIVCPHTAIRMKIYEPPVLAGAPDAFQSKPFRSRDAEGHLLTIQVAPDDCTGCGVCVDVCPARSKEVVRHKALDMAPAEHHRDSQREGFEFFLGIPEIDRDLLPRDTVKGSQVLEPLFEFSGACAGCGETPYLKLLTQLFGDRIVVANATGCSSIYGGNLPTTPWSTNADGRGPAWSNSLFEDNAEFGLGLRLGLEARQDEATRRLRAEVEGFGAARVAAILDARQESEGEIAEQRARVAELKDWLNTQDGDNARMLLAVADDLVRSSIWIVGGDGWAYDIGFGGLDHVLSSGHDVNVLVLDTEVYSNTGGQASKATPRGAVAKFASSGKPGTKKDLGAIARAYGNVYVAQIAVGASDIQTVKALQEADAWPGPSLVIAYSTCIAHGIDMSTSMSHQKDAVRSGYWPLYRFRPDRGADGRPFQLDSRAPSIPVSDFALKEARFSMLARTHPERAGELLSLAQADIEERWRYYEQLAGMVRRAPTDVPVDIKERS